MKGGFLNSIKANPEAFRSAFAGGKPKERASKARESESKYFHSSGLPADIAAELASIGFDNPKRVELPTASEMAQMGNVDIAAELAKHGMTMMNHDILKEDVYDKMNAPMKFATKSYTVLCQVCQDKWIVRQDVEKEYRKWFDAFLEDVEDWMVFFSVENNQPEWAERACGILNYLTTTYRQRADFTLCDEVMPHYKSLVQSYNAVVIYRKAKRLCEDENEVTCCRAKTYQYHRLAALLAYAMKRTRGMAESYRFLMQHEFDTGVADTPDAKWACMLPDFLQKPCTVQALRSTSDQELTFCCEMAHRTERISSPREGSPRKDKAAKSTVAVCARCHSVETCLSTYKSCARCKSVKYCGRECQVAHYAEHRAACKEAAEARNARKASAAERDA